MKATISNITILLFSVYSHAQCIKGNCDNGIGKYIYSGNSSYEGQFSRGNKHGKGKYIFNEGKYEGTFIENQKDGEGKLTYKTGEIYFGQFKKGTFQGKGKYIYSNGDVYKGHWQDGKKEGLGTYLFKNNDIYIGSFVNDKISGFGTLTTADQNNKTGLWQNGVLVEDKEASLPEKTELPVSIPKLTNCNEYNCDGINGRYKYTDGSIYEGMFINNQPQGIGICFYANGDKYEGGWKNHGPHGIGLLTFASGKKYGAKWSYGNPLKQITNTKPLAQKEKKKHTRKEFDVTVDIYACIIGIANYQHMPSLKYTDDDAYHLYAFLKSPEGGAISDKNINILIDDAATKKNIINELQSITKKADSNDVVIVYLSGHGLEGSYIPNDFDGFNNNLPYTEIINMLDSSEAKHKVCIADACHSGSMYASKTTYQGLQSFYTQMNELTGGTAFLTSSKSEEVSLEYSGLRHGVFSHYLIEGLKGNADTNYNLIVTIQELFEYVYASVRLYTNNNQTPTLKGDYNKELPISNIRELKEIRYN